MEGFKITYRDLNQQQQEEVDKRIELETSIAKEEAALEQEKLGFIEKEKALQLKQQKFNEMLDKVRSKESEKSLTAQRLQHLKERKLSLDEFLIKAAGQKIGLEESISFTGKQIQEEQSKIEELEKSLEKLKTDVEEKRKLFDDQRAAIDSLRKENQNIQRSQFDAEKKVAVADTSIQNIQRSITHLEEEVANRAEQLKQLEQDKKIGRAHV